MEIHEGVTTAQSRVLSVLRGEGRPLTIHEVHELTGLHQNTLRGHLNVLVAQQSVSRIAVRHGGRGRPAWSYLAREPEYAALAMALAAGLDAGQGQTLDPAAVRGGRAWGEQLRAQLDSVEDSRDRVVLALEHTGFAPVAEGDEVTLHACPLLDAARSHPAVVCAVHLGLVEGVLGSEGAGLRARPDTLGCVVSLP